ncbi:uncharacterized protein C20orf96 homolog [Alligator mississippiensis]|uniref:uncharacterized protein C20orf96 homolog n=1 Tax=Alligator mississippiensis TaxID=8496 RepID=UPI00287806A7|nr:uncharacterized protein C20orf96 homolog [Alligator mississippiensis]XP_059569123.1 uncharacterized protein C20orf96 homolog [Alligator mississippiensis]
MAAGCVPGLLGHTTPWRGTSLTGVPGAAEREAGPVHSSASCGRVVMAALGLSTLTPKVVKEQEKTDYSKWQRVEAKKKVSLPSIASPDRRKEVSSACSQRGRQPAQFGVRSASPAKSASLRKQRFAPKKTSAKDTELARSLDNIKIFTRLTRSQRTSLDKLKQHGAFLAETNERLVQEVQQAEDSAVKQVRELLQQYEVFGTMVTTLQDSSQHQLGAAAVELHEAEKTMENNLAKLQQELARVNRKVHALQDELGVLRTYMDKEYPAKAIQIDQLLRDIQSLKEEQQDETDELEEMARSVLGGLSKKMQEEQEQIIRAVIEEMLSPYKDGLQQMSANNRVLQKEVQMQKEIIKELQEDIMELQRGIQRLRWDLRDPREVIFADVLLRKPRCLPDEEVVLNVPLEGEEEVAF